MCCFDVCGAVVSGVVSRYHDLVWWLLHPCLPCFSCQMCLAARPSDPGALFCTACGSPLPKLPPATAPKVDDLESCYNCGSKMLVSSKRCLVCEAPAASAAPEMVRFSACMAPSGGHLCLERSPSNTFRSCSLCYVQAGELSSLDRRLCSTCGSLNPPKARLCLTCDALLPVTAASLVNLSSLLHSRTSREAPSCPPLESIKPSEPHRRLSPPIANCRICCRQNILGSRFCDWCGIQDPCDGEAEILNESADHFGGVCPKCFWQAPRDSRFCPQCGFNIAGVQKPASMFDAPKSNCFASSYLLYCQVLLFHIPLVLLLKKNLAGQLRDVCLLAPAGPNHRSVSGPSKFNASRCLVYRPVR